MPAAGRVIVSSIERGASGAELVIREARRDGRTSLPVVVGPMTSARPSGFARLAISGRRLVVAWLDVRTGADPQIRVRAAGLR